MIYLIIMDSNFFWQLFWKIVMQRSRRVGSNRINEVRVFYTWEEILEQSKVYWDEDYYAEGIVCHKN